MSRYLTTIPNSSGFYNLGTVESYPTGGAGPTAYGPTSYFGSDPLPERSGDSIYNPILLENFSSILKNQGSRHDFLVNIEKLYNHKTSIDKRIRFNLNLKA